MRSQLLHVKTFGPLKNQVFHLNTVNPTFCFLNLNKPIKETSTILCFGYQKSPIEEHIHVFAGSLRQQGTAMAGSQIQ